MSQELSRNLMRQRAAVVSLRASGGTRTVLLAMAASEDRAERVRELKAARPDLTWDKIATYCGVRERSAVEWARSGGISEQNAKKLATLFDISEEWLWSGREAIDASPDLMTTLSSAGRLDRIEAKLDAIMTHLKISLPEPETAVDVAQAAAQRRAKKPPQAETAPPPRKPKRQAA